jgi:NTE family protein
LQEDNRRCADLDAGFPAVIDGWRNEGWSGFHADHELPTAPIGVAPAYAAGEQRRLRKEQRMRAQPSKHASGTTLLAPRRDNLSEWLKPARRIVANENVGPRRLSATHRGQERPPFECIALLLQGGGALGAYQAGVYEALAEAKLHPDWVAGISVGAINSALIAGNPPDARVDRLRQFWEHVTDPSTAHAGAIAELSERIAASALPPWSPSISIGALQVEFARSAMNQLSAGMALVRGAQGFFAPRVPVPWLQPAGTAGATSYYDTGPLKRTLERLVDFDRINACETRFSVGAVNIATGNFVYFDNTTHGIGPEHVMASGALPPGFPPVEIEGEHYWDGGLVSNTPLQWVLESEPRQDTLAFQVDLWSARGAIPRTMAEVATRQKEIQYSSRTRANSDGFKHSQRLRNALASLLEKLPPEFKEGPEADLLSRAAQHKVYNLVHLIYRSKNYEGDSKDYEFSRLSMEDHWRAGYQDTVRTLRHPEVLARPLNHEGVLAFDLAEDGRG